MPKEWQGLTFRLHYRGAWLEITADGSNQAKVIRLAGEPVEAEINGKSNNNLKKRREDI